MRVRTIPSHMRLKAYRILAGYLKIEDAAKDTSIHRTMLSRYESGRVKPSADNQNKLAKFYNRTLDDLFGEQVVPN